MIWGADPTDLGLASDPVRFETATLDDEDVVWDDDGYPYTSVERTIADGFFLEGDLEHAAAALEDALWALHALDLARLRQLVEHHPLSSTPESSGTFASLVEAAGGYPLQPDRPYGFHRWRRYNPSRP
ncbi:hypothetical protein [Curtobacterium sp. 9128]|uniref:hypothetical protein n=1 Tax=Curtobacterium sp. 9128 TaxID=1793722 RepID=UPI0024819B02|nr:hypothetical protein [Curtobacterium sp. 9128]